MKKIIWMVLVVGLVVPMAVRAEEQSASASPWRWQNRTESREEQQEQRGIVQEFKSRVAENHANRLEKRFKFYYERMTKIMVRFQTRLDTLKAQGKETTPIQVKLDAAKAKLELAKTKGEAAVAAFRGLDPTKFQEQKTERLAARDLAKEARKLFLEAHALLKEALKSLKTISKPALPAASSAVENAQ